MKRVWPIVATIAALTAACLVTATTHAVAANSADPPVRQVTLILAPYLTWGDITPTSTPAIWRLAEKGALAGVNARSRVREPGQGATPIEGALAISAGAWALPEWSAQPAYTATEPVAGGTAADAYERIFGASMDPARIAYLGLPMTARANEKGSVDIVLGTLGQAVRDAGGLTAAIGNSDIGFSESDAILQRPAAIAAMDASGLVALRRRVGRPSRAVGERPVRQIDGPRRLRGHARSCDAARPRSQGAVVRRAGRRRPVTGARLLVAGVRRCRRSVSALRRSRHSTRSSRWPMRAQRRTVS